LPLALADASRDADRSALTRPLPPIDSRVPRPYYPKIQPSN